MKVIAINGSPRKQWNTAILLQNALDGAASVGAETELIHLYDLKFTGCLSCFSCKRIGSKSYGRCALKDDLTPVLDKIHEADALIMGSPIYIGNVTAAMRALIERLLYQYALYTPDHTMLFGRTMPVGWIYTMNVNDEQFKTEPYGLSMVEDSCVRTFGPTEKLYVTDTYQFTDYSKYITTIFDADAKKKRREEHFYPVDCKNAFDMGVRLASFKQE